MQVGVTSVNASGGSPDVNTLGGKALPWSSGSGVSGGVLTLSPGVYWVVLTTNSTHLQLSYYGDTTAVTPIMNASGGKKAVNSGGSAVSTGSGSVVFLADLSGIPSANVTSNAVDVCAFLN